MASEPRPQPKVKKGPPLPWTEETIPERATPALPVDPDEAAVAFRRDAKRRRPRLLEALPDDE